MNFILSENLIYLSIFEETVQLEEFMQKELSQIHGTEKDNPIVSSLIMQYNNISTIKGLVFSCLLRNNMHCIQIRENKEDYIAIETPEKTYKIEKEILQTILGDTYDEVMLSAKEPERANGSAISLNENIKKQLEDNYRNEIKENLTQAVKEELKTKLASEVRDILKDELTDEIKNELKTNLEADVRKELKDELEDSVTQELKTELMGVIRHEMKNDLREDVTHEIKTEIEKEVRAEATDNIRENIQKEIDEKTSIKFLQEQEKKITLQENQLMASINHVTIEQKGTILHEMDIYLFPTSVPQVDEKQSPEIIAAIKENDSYIAITPDRGKAVIYYPMDDIGHDVSLMIRGKWTAGGTKIQGVIYLVGNTNGAEIKISQTQIAPKDYDRKNFMDTFFRSIEISGNKKLNLYVFPLQRQNIPSTSNVPILILGNTGAQQIVYATGNGGINKATFDLGNRNLELEGYWENGLFVIRQS